MNTQTRHRLTSYFAKSLNLLVIVAMLVTMLPAPASYARPPRQEPVVEVSPTPTLTPTPQSGNIATPGPQTIYLPLILRGNGVEPPTGETELLIEPGLGGVITAFDKSVSAAFSNKAVTQATWVRYQSLTRPTIVTPTLAVGGPAFLLTAWEAANNQPVTQFPDEVTIIPTDGIIPAYAVITPSLIITVTFNEADIWGLDVRTLSLYHRAGADQSWQRVPTAVYPEQKLLVAEVNQLGEFVPLGVLAGLTGLADPKRLVLDPDDDVGHATWPEVGEVRETPYSVRLNKEVRQRFIDDSCTIDILLTRESETDTSVSRSTRANMANGFGAEMFATLTFNAFTGTPWGLENNGGIVGWARSGRPEDDALVTEFYNRIQEYTGRPHRRPVQHPAFYSEFDGSNLSSTTYSHIETLFLDHNFDWPVIDTGFSFIVDAAYVALRTRLETMGMTCSGDPNDPGDSPTPPPLPPPPSAEQLKRWRDLGYQNYQRYGADPVSFSTGNHVLQVALFRIPGRGGLDIDFTLTYNAQDGRDELFGYGWSFPYNIHTQHYNDDSVSIILHDGRTYHYTWNGSRYQAPEGVFDTLEQTGEGWRWTMSNQMVLTFTETVSGLGILTEWRDRRGNGLHFTYDLSGQDNWKTGDEVPRPPLLTMSDDAGRTITFTSNDSHITDVTLPDDRTFSFEYTNSDLTGITDANEGTRRFQYDERHRITHEWDPENILFLQNIYDDRDRVIEQIDASEVHSYLSYDPINRVTTFTDNLGNDYRYFYDELNRVTAEEYPLEHLTRYEYDPDYNLIKVIDARGAETHYEYDNRGNRTKQIEPVASCNTADYASDATIWEYNEQNDLIRTVNALNFETTFDYDLQGNLLAIHEPESRDTTFTYNTWGQPTSMTDANHHTTFYDYDDYGNLIKTTDAEENISTSTYDLTGRELTYTDANDHTVTFKYDNNDNITRITDPKDRDTTFTYNLNDLLIQSKDRRGVASDYQYDENLKLVAERDFPNGQWQRYGYDALYRRVTMTDRRGYVTHYEYDQTSRLTAMIDPLGAATRYEYDENDNLTAVIKPLGQRTEMVYDAINRLSFLIDAAGYKTEYCYDAEDRLIRVTGPRGEVTRYEYDAVNNLVTEIDPLGAVTRYEYDKVDNLKAMIDAADHRTDYVYDKIDRLTTISQPPVRVPGASTPQHPTTGFAYDGVGNTLAITSPRGFVTIFTYDENDNLQTVTDPLGGQVSYAYDEEDNPISVTDPKGYPTTYSYNEAGLPVQIKDPLGHTTRLVYDAGYYLERMLNALNRPTIYEYDPAGRLIREADPLGNTTLYQRDLQGQVTAKTDANGHTTRYSYDVMDRLSMVTDALNQATRYEYDPAGNLVTIIDANNHLTRFTYDLRNQLTKEVNPLDRTWEYSYDAVGSLVRRVDGNRQVTHYSYDSNKRLVGIDYPDATDVRFAYDLDSNEVEMCDWLIAEGDCTRTEYDALGRPVRSTDWLGRTIQRAYDASGNLTRLIYPNNQPVIYDYDARNLVTGLLDHFGQRTTYAYNPVGQLTRINRPNGTTTNYTYDEANRLLNLTHQKEHSTFSAFTYALDKVGNRTQIAELRTFPGDGDPIPVTTVKSYSYDALDRLITAGTDQGQAIDYSFDPVGNRLQQAGIPQQVDPTAGVEPIRPAPPVENGYKYNEANQLTRINGLQSTTNLEYDGNGNRVREAETLPNGVTHLTEYRYDYENRLTGVVKAERSTTQITVTMVATYTYDGYGRRVRKEVEQRIGKGADEEGEGRGQWIGKGADEEEEKGRGQRIGGGNGFLDYEEGQSVLVEQQLEERSELARMRRQTITYVYDGLDPIADYETVGSVTTATHYYWANDGIAEIERLPNPTTDFGGDVYWTHTDGLGSLTDLTDAAGERAVQIYYDEYGQLLTRAVSLGRYSYTGQEFDPETGLYHFYARYYEPERGGWLTQDIYRGRLVEPVTLHRYGYVGGNPVRFVDWYGFDRKRAIQIDTEVILKHLGFDLNIDKEAGTSASLLNLFNPDECTFFSCDTWLKIDNFSRKHDQGIRIFADVVGLVPVAGGLWKDNILYATGKIETRKEFITKQVVNTLLGILDVAGNTVRLGIHLVNKPISVAIPKINLISKVSLQTGLGIAQEVALRYQGVADRKIWDNISAELAKAPIRYSIGKIDELDQMIFPRGPGRPLSIEGDWSSRIGQFTLSRFTFDVLGNAVADITGECVKGEISCNKDKQMNGTTQGVGE